MELASKIRPTPRSPLTVYADPGNVIATFHSIVIVIAFKPPNESMGAALVKGAKDLAARLGGSGVYVLVDAAHEPPDGPARVAMQRILSSLPKESRGLALNLEGQGFVAAAKRSVTSLIIMTARPPTPVKVFSSTIESASWLLQRLDKLAPPGVGPQAFVQVCESLRADFLAGKVSLSSIRQ